MEAYKRLPNPTFELMISIVSIRKEGADLKQGGGYQEEGNQHLWAPEQSVIIRIPNYQDTDPLNFKRAHL